MHHRRVTRFRPRILPRALARLRRFQSRIGTLLLAIVGLGLAGVLIYLSAFWANEDASNAGLTWLEAQSMHSTDPVEDAWQAHGWEAPICTGDEPAVIRELQARPLLEAVLDRSRPGMPIWVRSGDRLLPCPGDCGKLRTWATEAIAASTHTFTWNPPKDSEPQPVILITNPRFILVQRWRFGSPQVERLLRTTLAKAPDLRIAITPEEWPARLPAPEPWGAEPHLQADLGHLRGVYFSPVHLDTLGPGWMFTVMTTKARMAIYRRIFWLSLLKRESLALLILGIAALGLWLRHRALVRSQLETDRMASLTHSLKTPLAILKMRCDSLRLGRLSPERADQELLKLGDEVDSLTALIEEGLRALRSPDAEGERNEVSGSWVAEIVEDLRPVYEQAGRSVEARIAPIRAQANPDSLQAAITTLVENALHHGEHKVTLSWQRRRTRVLLRVSDQGKGLDRHQLGVLCKPFMRLRAKGDEGFHREGQGLGLSLLKQVAAQEGWGLTLTSAPGKGFTATIELMPA